MALTSSTRRITKGNGHSYLLDGHTVDGVTSILRDGVPKPALVQWSANTCANVVVDRWDELTTLTPSQRADIIKKAPNSDRDAGARRGSEVHRLADQLAHDQEVTVPDELVGHVDAYLKFLDDWNVKALLLETVVINRRHQYMGTLDMVAILDHDTWLLDIKTTRSGVFAETALQLAAYRHAENYLDDQNRECPMPAVDRCGAIWVRADGYDLIPIEAGPDVFRDFLYAQQVANFCRNGKQLIGDALYPPNGDTR